MPGVEHKIDYECGDTQSSPAGRDFCTVCCCCCAIHCCCLPVCQAGGWGEEEDDEEHGLGSGVEPGHVLQVRSVVCVLWNVGCIESNTFRHRLQVHLCVCLCCARLLHSD